MKDCYTIEDMAVFTGLTDRTLRNYLNEGRLTGEKVDGAWRFSPEDLGRLLRDGGARRALEANRNAAVYDFMLGGPGEDRCCVIRDIPVPDGEEEAVRTRLVERVNGEESRVSFSYSYGLDRQGRGSARVILVGSTAVVQKILADT